MSDYRLCLLKKLAKRVSEDIAKANHHIDGNAAYVVGGFVRDLFLRRYSNDIDIVVFGDVFAIAKDFADHCGGSFVTLDSKHHAYRVVFTKHNISVDIVAPKGKDIEEDLNKRDFTVNALAIPLHVLIQLYSSIDYGDSSASLHSDRALEDCTIDRVNGRQDIIDRRIRVVYDSAIVDDPLRILRGVRLAGHLGFEIMEETRKCMQRDRHGIDNVSYERIREELWSILTLKNGSFWIRYLWKEVGILSRLVPGIDAYAADGIERISKLEALVVHLKEMENKMLVEYLSTTIAGGHTRIPLLKFAALIQGIGKYGVRDIKQRWKLSKKEASILTTYINWELQMKEDISLASFHDIYETYNEEALGAMMLRYVSIETDNRIEDPNNSDTVRVNFEDYIMRYIEYARQRQHLNKLFSGKEIIEVLGVAQGKRVSELLLRLERAQLDGTVATTEEARDYLEGK